MTGKQNAVFWLAMTMILLNFWVGGQSTVIWNLITGKSAPAPPSKPPGKQAPGKGVKPGPNFPNPHGFVQLWLPAQVM